MGQALELLERLAARQEATEGRLDRIDARTQGLTPAHAHAVQSEVTRLAHETAKGPLPLTYAVVYGRLKHHFKASSYSAIADERFSDVLAFLGEELRRATSGQLPAHQQGSLF